MRNNGTQFYVWWDHRLKTAHPQYSEKYYNTYRCAMFSRPISGLNSEVVLFVGRSQGSVVYVGLRINNDLPT